ncbi:hypothetical protein B9Z65_1783 [Elsinoe australis]|uniref:Uncharacterized protein n=1 Tax=Elsinoe australis TaxID=40998 RepID=A0A2P7YKX4_9PEZI|nr:hypothetical protein B9Z65_1783 [Elsinoe australis]
MKLLALVLATSAALAAAADEKGGSGAGPSGNRPPTINTYVDPRYQSNTGLSLPSSSSSGSPAGGRFNPNQSQGTPNTPLPLYDPPPGYWDRVPAGGSRPESTSGATTGGTSTSVREPQRPVSDPGASGAGASAPSAAAVQGWNAYGTGAKGAKSSGGKKSGSKSRRAVFIA